MSKEITKNLIINLLHSRQQDLEDVRSLINGYIYEMKEKNVDINVNSMVSRMDLTEIAFNSAIEYYKKKFNIVKITDKQGVPVKYL